MRIIHVIDYFQPKLGYQEYFLAKEHQKLGHDVYVITSDRYSPLVYEGNKKLLGKRIVGSGFFVEEGVKVCRLKTLFEGFHNVWMLGLEKKIKELNPDLIISHGIVKLHSIRLARLKKKLNFKLIYDDHMTFDASHSILRFLYPFFRFLFTKKICKSADALVGVAEVSRRFMNEKYGFPLKEIKLIPLGADNQLFKFSDTYRKKIRKKFKIRDDEILFIYAGKLIPVKGPYILIDAMLELADRYNNIKLLLIGSGPENYLDELKERIKEKSKEDKFIWCTAIPNRDLYKFYSAADVGVWPREASLTMIEAMSCRLPIIISSNSQVLERLEYNNGLIYKDGDSKDLAKKMEKMFDPKLRKTMGINSEKLVKDKLNWRSIAKKFIELVE